MGVRKLGAAIAAAFIAQAGIACGQTAAPREFLAGYDAGLYRVEAGGDRAYPLWLDGEVRKIVSSPLGWYFLTSKGLLHSRDLAVFEDRSRGLPAKTYKRYAAGAKSFSTETMDLKDLEIDLSDPRLVATCTKDGTYLSRDGGLTWESHGTPVATTGLKAVGLAAEPGSAATVLWASHPIKGLYYKKITPVNSPWKESNAGLATLAGTTSVEEIADIVPARGNGSGAWASNSFLSRIYRLDKATGAFAPAWSIDSDFGCVESLSALSGGDLRFVTEGVIARLSASTGLASPDDGAMAVMRAALRAKPDWQLLSLSWPEGGGRGEVSELWLASFKDRKPYRSRAENRVGFYLATHFVVGDSQRAKYDQIMDRNKIDSVVVDMKDDFGKLRFEPRDSAIQKVGKVAAPLDVESFASSWKAKGRYLIARIPVFKDEVAYKYSGGAWAAWDAQAGTPWRGYNLVTKSASPPIVLAAPNAPVPSVGPAPAPPAAPAPKNTTERVPIEEFWVDPYCEEAWAYNVAIANEMIARGFDEVQFDYIRFPTDGENIGLASYRWRDAGMDKESALASFLRYARENIAAPISVDIYGANGWYRSGVRTGQDVELMAKYVDVICPMLYPSHFEQTFLAQAPAEMRPYRIYRVGTLRNSYIARKRVVVRPYVQAFYLNVSYDKAYYGPDYVRREIEGVRDSVNLGLTFWNNSGRYDDIPILDIGPDGRLSSAAAQARILD
ncbi:MAG: putative glycoside hydrolase [Spirochaetaceae bacterium]|nr:putative glycoside hydrolase [Spirochaetaceae bacterium]